jgi:hypothetical protein
MKMSIWNLLTLLLLIGTFGMLVIFGAIFILPNQILPASMRPINIPPTPIIPTATETPFQFPPTWTKIPPLPTETSTPLSTSTPTPTKTSIVVPSMTLTPTRTVSITATMTMTRTRTPVSIGGGGTASRTPTKTRTKTPNKTATDCPPGQCFTKAVDDKVTVPLYPGYIVVNVRANDLPAFTTMHITNLLNCPKPCQEDKHGFYKTYGGGKAIIISQTEIAYYPPLGFIGTDVIGYKITSDSGSVDTANVLLNVTDGSYPLPTDITPHTLYTDAGLPIPSSIGSFSTSGGSGSFTYKLVTGDGSTNNNYFSLTTGGDLNSAGTFTASVLTIRVRSTDSNNFWIEQAVQIFVAMTPTPTRTQTPTRTLTPTRTPTSTPTSTPTNSPPVITEGASVSVSMSVDGSPTPFSLTLHATDADAGTTFTWSILSGASNGTASASGTGASKAISYTPNALYVGPDSFTVQVSDGSDTDSIVVNVTVGP